MKRTPLRRVSKKRQEQLDQYQAFRKRILIHDEYTCRLCLAAKLGIFITDNPHPALKEQMLKLEIHHVNGRTGERLLYEKDAITLCAWHHKYSRFAPHVDEKRFNKIMEKLSDY